MKRGISATRAVASLIGIDAGLCGIEHGFFEMLQGNVPTGGLLIDAIGPQAGVAGSEPALTIIPNFLVTGVVAIIVSFIVIIWAAAFVQRKNGGVVLILLSILQLFVGGGLAPIGLAIPAAVVATRINMPLTWWRTHLPANSQGFLAKLWPWPFLAFFLLSFIDLEVAIFGNNPGLINILPPFVFGFLFLAIITGFAYDIRVRPNTVTAEALIPPIKR